MHIMNLWLIITPNQENSSLFRTKRVPMARIFLAIVGAAYLVLAGWCALMPDKTSRAVGFSLQTGSGQSEFLTVYGGLQLSLGLAFLWPLLRPS